MIQEQDLQTIFIILYDNNPSGYNLAFINAGYAVPSNSVQAKVYVVRKIYELYISNPVKLKEITDSVSWNTNPDNYTNQYGDIRGQVSMYLADNISSPSGKINWANIQGNLQNWLFGNQETVINQTTTTPSKAGPIAGVVGLSLLAIGIIIMAIVLIKRMASNKKALILIIVGALTLLSLIGVLIYRVASKITGTTTTGSSTTTGHGGLTDLLGNIGNIGGWWSGIFGGGNNTVTSSDLGCDITECDPNKSGYNMCGDKWLPCD